MPLTGSPKENDVRNPTRVGQPSYNLLPTDIEGVDSLAELALDMRWSWNHATDNVWRQLDPALWELTHNPTDGEQHAFEVEVYLGGLAPEAVRVELYADGVKDAAPVRQEMKRVRNLKGSPDGSLYRGVVSAVRPPADYTPRAIPRRAGIALPLEEARIAWQR
jgi:starch phosphorylase